MASKPGHELSGKTSDRIRSGKIPNDAVPTGKARPQADETPSTDAIRRAEGHGLGRGASRGRNGGN
jgi:hypothetical protein